MSQAVTHPLAVNHVSPRCVSSGPSHSLRATQRLGVGMALTQREGARHPKWVKAKGQGDGCEVGGGAHTLSGGGWGGPHLRSMVACGDPSPYVLHGTHQVCGGRTSQLHAQLSSWKRTNHRLFVVGEGCHTGDRTLPLVGGARLCGDIPDSHTWGSSRVGGAQPAHITPPLLPQHLLPGTGQEKFCASGQASERLPSSNWFIFSRV